MIYKMVQNAFRDAKNEAEELGNYSRSKLWVEKLAQEFRLEYKLPSYRVFSSDYSENRTAFKVNELLYDISVVKIGVIKSASKKVDLEYIKSCDWLIESEFHSSNSRESIIDLSKLFMGRSTNKLIVLPKSSQITTWAIKELPNIIPLAEARYYLALVPHPNTWFQSGEIPDIYILENNVWAELKS